MRKTDTEQLEALKQREAQLKAKIAKIEARKVSKERKEDTRLKVLVGAALLADAKLHTATENFLRAVLPRAVVAPRDRDFLKAKGWQIGRASCRERV